MNVKITLNADDIKILIAEKYNVSVDKIHTEFHGRQSDGIYSTPGSCYFSFDANLSNKEIENA